MTTVDPILGQTLAGRYLARRLLGAGRSGRVYLGLDPVLKRKVALKVLHAPLCSDEEQLARFEREFTAASRIGHANTVRMHELVRHGDHRVLVMELLEGRRLDELLASQRKLPPLKVARIAAQIARALAATHEVGVLHRDLNPSNVLLCTRRGDEHELVKVLDFGLARLLDTDDDLTATGQRLGRDHYMAPEYIGQSRFDARSDLYALGCVTYELLTGHPPFIGPSMKVLDGHANRPVPAPSADVPNLPQWLDEIVLQLLAKSPDDRLQPASAVADQLERGLESEPIATSASTQPPSQQRSLPSTVSTGLAHTAHVEPQAPRRAAASSWTEIGLRVFFVALLLAGSTLLAAALTWVFVVFS